MSDFFSIVNAWSVTIEIPSRPISIINQVLVIFYV